MTATEEAAAEAAVRIDAEAAERTVDVVLTEDAAAAGTQGGEAGQAEATTSRSGSQEACPVV